MTVLVGESGLTFRRGHESESDNDGGVTGETQVSEIGAES
jgi:hypothetical protein